MSDPKPETVELENISTSGSPLRVPGCDPVPRGGRLTVPADVGWSLCRSGNWKPASAKAKAACEKAGKKRLEEREKAKAAKAAAAAAPATPAPADSASSES